MQSLFEAIDRSGLVKGRKVQRERVARVEAKRLLDLAEEVREITSSERLERENSIYSYSSSISLGGGRSDCVGISCRLNRAKELAQFAGLYADKVYIKNFLDDCFHDQSTELRYKEDRLRSEVTNDLLVLALLRPLIEEGRITPVTMPKNSCPACLAKQGFGRSADRRYVDEFLRLTKEVTDSTSFYFSKRDANFYVLEYMGPDYLCSHGGMGEFHFTSVPLELNLATARSKLDSGQRIQLTSKQVHESEIAHVLAGHVFNNVAFEITSAQCLNTSFLAERELYLDILGRITADETIRNRNAIIEKYLRVLVPFLDDVPIERLSTLRGREEAAFLAFRQTLNKAVDAVGSEKGQFTEKDAKALYADVIEPGLAKMKDKANSAKKDLVKGAAAKGAAWLGSISFGMYTGLVPAELMAAAQTLGLTAIVAQMAEILLKLPSESKEVRGQDLYFLWRVSKKSGRQTAK